jgi:hypothetical protein
MARGVIEDWLDIAPLWLSFVLPLGLAAVHPETTFLQALSAFVVAYGGAITALLVLSRVIR